MPSGGEAPQVKGRRYDEKCYRLLDTLGYKSILRHKYGFDMVGNPPAPNATLIKPVFAPRDKTAFEFKAGAEIAIRPEARKLRRKIDKAKRSKKHTLKGIENGILVIESIEPERTKRKIFADFSVYVWDWPVVLFLASKVSVLKRLSEPGRRIREEKIGAWTSALRLAKTYRNSLRIDAYLFYQRLFEELDSGTFRHIVAHLTRRLEASANALDLRGYVSLQTLSLSGVTDECLEGYKKILNDMSAGRIIYESKIAQIHSFDTAPWDFLVT
jgi:hypothetical protein